MSSDACVVPVSWARLTEVILPAWAEVLTGDRECESFCRDYSPGLLHWFLPRHAAANEEWAIPLPTYLADINWSLDAPILAADHLRRSTQHQALVLSGFADFGNSALCHAVQTVAGVDLAGPDPFDTSGFFRYYGRSHLPPHHQVAGTKNQFHFLEDLFEVTYEPDRQLYRYAAKPSFGEEILALLEALFLFTRAFPGTRLFVAENRTWPGADDVCVAGYLSPREVERLASSLEQFNHRSEEPEWDLFPLFADRVRRSAEQGLALVTLRTG